ncbi:hypothetical protein KAI87_07835 [Myxococcota bacterium]|nr:hypothetical protein [Myxococcota bacterium]
MYSKPNKSLLIASNLQRGILTNLAVGFAAALVLIKQVPTIQVSLFYGLILLTGAGRLYLVKRLKQQETTPPLKAKYQLLHDVLSTLMGLIWGSTAFMTMRFGSWDSQLVMLLFVLGLSAGAVSTLGSMPRPFILFIFAIIPPHIVSLLLTNHEFSWILSALALIFLLVILSNGRTYSQQLVSLRDQNEALKTSRDMADRANKAKTEFLGSMSHEFRTPLNAVLGFAQLIDLDTTLSESHRQNNAEIIMAGDHLLNLINQMLDLSKLEVGKMEIAIKDIRLREVIEECGMLALTTAVKYGVELQFEKSECGTEALVRADRTRLIQILLNFLSNAAKYNKTGGSIRIHCEKQNGPYIRVNVTDTGIGISENKGQKLFQAFERLGADRTNISGTGIGLALSQKLAEAMDCSIGYESEKDVGSTFWIELEISSDDTSTTNKHQAETLLVNDN